MHFPLEDSPEDSPDTAVAVAVEVAFADVGIRLGDFPDIALVASWAVNLLGQRHAACTYPVDKALLHYRGPCHGLYRKYSDRQGAGRILVAVAAPTAGG